MIIKYPLLIDGGLSNVLEKQGCDLNQKLWSAKLLESNPEAIIRAHDAYLNSGSKCIITSSYQASIPGFGLSYPQVASVQFPSSIQPNMIHVEPSPPHTSHSSNIESPLHTLAQSNKALPPHTPVQSNSTIQLSSQS